VFAVRVAPRSSTLSRRWPRRRELSIFEDRVAETVQDDWSYEPRNVALYCIESVIAKKTDPSIVEYCRVIPNDTQRTTVACQQIKRQKTAAAERRRRLSSSMPYVLGSARLGSARRAFDGTPTNRTMPQQGVSLAVKNDNEALDSPSKRLVWFVATDTSTSTPRPSMLLPAASVDVMAAQSSPLLLHQQ